MHAGQLPRYDSTRGNLQTPGIRLCLGSSPLVLIRAPVRDVQPRHLSVPTPAAAGASAAGATAGATGGGAAGPATGAAATTRAGLPRRLGTTTGAAAGTGIGAALAAGP